MRLLLSFFLLFFFSFFAFHATASINLIHQTCKTSAQKDPNLTYKFCITSLQAAPASRCANLRGLGLISMTLIQNNVTDTRCYMKELLSNKELDPYVRACLNDCVKLYSDAILSLRQGIRDYHSKHYQDSNIHISSVLDASATCEDGFQDKRGVVSPLTKRNNHTFQLSAISLSIVNMLR